jgi:hypothetical protein
MKEFIIKNTERFFSQGTNIISRNRNKLTKINSEKILCLRNWGIKEKKRRKE